jgi:MSHA pilin protein MshC
MKPMRKPADCCLSFFRLGQNTPQSGFTLIELIMVIVLLGILAVYAVPRMLNTNDFYARGFHDQSLAYLRYAQKTAIAQRRTVCVTLSSNGIALRIAAAESTYNCTAVLAGPSGEASLAARPGVAFSSALTSFVFDGLGQPLTSAGVAMPSQILQVAGVSQSITVESATGYVHD